MIIQWDTSFFGKYKRRVFTDNTWISRMVDVRLDCVDWCCNRFHIDPIGFCMFPRDTGRWLHWLVLYSYYVLTCPYPAACWMLKLAVSAFVGGEKILRSHWKTFKANAAYHLHLRALRCDWTIWTCWEELKRPWFYTGSLHVCKSKTNVGMLTIIVAMHLDVIGVFFISCKAFQSRFQMFDASGGHVQILEWQRFYCYIGALQHCRLLRPC